MIRPLPYSGRPPLLSHEQMAWVAKTVRDKTPPQLRFELSLWTIKLIRHLIERELGVKLSAISPRGELRFMLHEGSVNAHDLPPYSPQLNPD